MWLNNAQYWLLPGICIACRQVSGRQFDLCAACEAGFVPIEAPCRGCALPLPPGSPASQLCGSCLKGARPLRHTVAGHAYTDPVRTLISQFKYQGKLQHGRVLTSLLEGQIREYYRDVALPDVLIPVPLHAARLRERGFNQALVMATQLGRNLRLPVAPRLIQRHQQTPPQQGLSARARKRNLRGAFSLTATEVPATCRGIALIDDVVTTTSTVREIVNLLHRHSRQELVVHVWCLARA